MTATADLILERRRLRRRLTFWRILAILALVAAAMAAIPRTGGPVVGDHLARIRIDGIILADPRRDAMLAELARAKRVEGVIVHINSPGGTVVGSEALYEQLRAIAANKPVVAVMSEAAASGGYITAIAADHIVARGNTLTGSIGVIAEIPNFVGLMEKLGIGVTKVKSAPLKAEPSFDALPTPEALAAQRVLIEDSFAWFKGLVSERRGIAGAALDAVSDGRVFTGRMALELGLIDAIGDESTARAWLESERGIDARMRVEDYDWTESPLPWPASIVEKSLAGLLSPSTVQAAGPRLYAIIQ